MSDKDHIRTLYELMAERQRKYEESCSKKDKEIDLLKNKLRDLEIIYPRLRIQREMLETYTAFVNDIFVEDPSGNILRKTDVMVSYKDWSLRNPSRKKLLRKEINNLISLLPITNKKFKEWEPE